MKIFPLLMLVLASAALTACAPVEELPSLPAVATPTMASQDI